MAAIEPLESEDTTHFFPVPSGAVGPKCIYLLAISCGSQYRSLTKLELQADPDICLVMFDVEVARNPVM